MAPAGAIRPNTHLALLPDSLASRTPGATCIDDDRVELSCAQFARRVRAVADDLRRRGVGPGDVVAVMLWNRVELVVVVFAAWRVGAVVTPIDPSLTTAKAGYQLVDSEARLLVRDGTSVQVGGVAVIDVAALPTAPACAEPAPHADRSALALLAYSSGTTGAPRGVMLDHANLSVTAAMVVDALLTPDDHCLLIVPAFHVDGMVTSVFAPLLRSAERPDDPPDPRKETTTVADTFPAVPTECSCHVPRGRSDGSLDRRQETPGRASVSCHQAGAVTLRVALDQVLAGEPVQATVRVEILESWRRAATWGLLPDRVETPYELAACEAGRDLDSAGEEVVRTLGDDLVGTHTTVVLADERGRILRRRTADPAAPDQLDRVRLAPGAVWGEPQVGTNGIGTTLQRGTATLVASDEHFAESLTVTWSAGAPIHEPDSGRVVGVVGIFCRAHDATGLMMGLARRAARDVEQRLREQIAGHQGLLRDRFSCARRHARGPVALVAADTLLTNAAAARLLCAADRAPLWAWAADAPASTATPLRLASGASVVATAEPVRSGARVVGVVVRMTTGPGDPVAKSSRGRLPGPAARFGWASLTPSELAIAERVARGHTNREVAADLFMSPHTIDTHLRHIYGKLGITSRVQLTRLVISNSELADLDTSGVA